MVSKTLFLLETRNKSYYLWISAIKTNDINHLLGLHENNDAIENNIKDFKDQWHNNDRFGKL